MVFSSSATMNTKPHALSPSRMARQGSDASTKVLPSKGVPANVMNPNGLTLADAEELHSRKWKTSALNIFPFIALPKLVWDAVFFNPSKAAADRDDFLHGERSYASAIQQEKRKKNAQLKASLLPVVLGVPLHFAFENKSFLSKVMFASIPAILTALGYGLLENPKAKNFNEKL
jgi:hypothetical protein